MLKHHEESAHFINGCADAQEPQRQRFKCLRFKHEDKGINLVSKCTVCRMLGYL